MYGFKRNGNKKRHHTTIKDSSPKLFMPQNIKTGRYLKRTEASIFFQQLAEQKYKELGI